MSDSEERLYPNIILVLVVLLVTLPYIFATTNAGENHIFNGFLLNPIDGNTYLAKMYQGWEGKWRFDLPYTTEPGEGVFLNLFYISLGHFARTFNLHLIFVFHVFRILGSIVLLKTMWWFYGANNSKKLYRKIAFTIAAIGSGMGWMLVPFGYLTSDFWVAEAYPFLSSYANPHFPIGLALLLIIIYPNYDRNLNTRDLAVRSVSSFMLSILNPFCVVIALMVLGGLVFWMGFKKVNIRNISFRWMTVAISGLPFIIYYLWIIKTHPILSIWNDQNITISPEAWDLIISISPLVFLCIVSFLKIVKKKVDSNKNFQSMLAIWIVLGLIIIVVPLNIQRRFMTGLYIPLAGFAAYGLESFVTDSKRRYSLTLISLLILILPTNLIIILGGLGSIRNHDPQIYLTSYEGEILNYINEELEQDSVIVCSPSMGLFIPAYTGRRVIYGHPYETAFAEEKEFEVNEFFKNSLSEIQKENFLLENNAQYVLIGPREREIGEVDTSMKWEMVFYTEGIELYRVAE